MNDSTVKVSPRTIRIIWLAFLVAPVIYCFTAWKVTSVAEAGTLSLTLGAAFAVMAMTTAIAGFVVPGIVARQQVATDNDIDPLAVYQTSMIVRYACFEAVAIYGFVLTIMSVQLLPAVAGAVVAVTLIASSPPRPEQVA